MAENPAILEKFMRCTLLKLKCKIQLNRTPTKITKGVWDLCVALQEEIIHNNLANLELLIHGKSTTKRTAYQMYMLHSKPKQTHWILKVIMTEIRIKVSETPVNNTSRMKNLYKLLVKLTGQT